MGEAERVDVDELYRSQRLPMVRLAYLLVDDLATAEDVVQAAFVGLWRHRGSLRQPEAAVGYLRRSVVNEARSMLRRRRTVRSHLRVAEPTQAEPADALVLRAEEHDDVLALVRHLPPRMQEVLILRYWSGLSETEIAKTLGVSAGTVKSQASRALSRLQTKLEEPDD